MVECFTHTYETIVIYVYFYISWRIFTFNLPIIKFRRQFRTGSAG